MIEWGNDIFNGIDHLTAANAGADLEKSLATAERKPLPAGGHWITINGGTSTETGEHHGTHIYINGSGQVLAGPKALEGRNVKSLSKPPAPEQLQPPRDLKSEGLYKAMKEVPSHDDIVHHLLTHHKERYTAPDGKIDHEWVDEDAQKIRKEFEHLNAHKELHGSAIMEAKDRMDEANYGPSAKDFDPIRNIRSIRRHAEERYEDGLKKLKEMQERADAPKLKTREWTPEQIPGVFGNPPDLERLQQHFNHIWNERFKKKNGRDMTEKDVDHEIMPHEQDYVKEIHGLLQRLNTPRAREIAQDIAARRQIQRLDLFNVRDVVNDALIEAADRTYTTSTGAILRINPNSFANYQWKDDKGKVTRKRLAYEVRVQYPGAHDRALIRYLDANKAGKVTDKDFGEDLAGIGQDGMEWLKQLVNNRASGKPEQTFKPKQRRTKPTAEYSMLEKPQFGMSEKERKAWFTKLENDLLAHGASQVLQLNPNKMTDVTRLRVAWHVSTALRAIYHTSGGDAPSVGIVIGDANPKYSNFGKLKGKAAAFYSSNKRSITVDNQVGSDTFFHEYGHFIDNALNDYKGYASHVEGSATNELIKELQKDPAYHARVAAVALQNPENQDYYNTETAIFARFFDQWMSHEAKKRGYELPDALQLDAIQQARLGYEKYKPETLEKAGGKLQKILKDAGLWKSLITLLYILSETKLY